MGRGGYMVGLNLDRHDLFVEMAKDSFWQHVDSQPSAWWPNGNPYRAARGDGCLAAKSDGFRCGQIGAQEDDPFCAFHMTRALEWFLGRATAEQIRSERNTVKQMGQDARRIVADAQRIVGAAGVNGSRVYFYELPGQGLVKIGTSRRPETRTRQFRTGKGCTFPPDCDPSVGQLIGHMAGDHAVEAALHQRFRGARVAGEWFRLTDELAAFIEASLDDLAQPA